jgi:O-antigen ligase
MWPWWFDNANPWTGTGTGTFFWLGPTAQMAHGPVGAEGYFTYMHSDWLQILWEQGIPGLVLAFAIAVAAFRKLNAPDRGVLCGLSVMALSQMPLRFPLCAMVVVLILRRAFVRDPR